MSIDTTARRTDPVPAHLPTLCSVAQLATLEPALTVGSIREDLFYRASNGLEASGAVVYRGRKILLHRERYLAWLIAGRKSAEHPPRGGRRAAA